MRAQVDVSNPIRRAASSIAARSSSVRRMRRTFSLTSTTGFFGLPAMLT